VTRSPVLCDLDGVVWLAHRAVPGSADAVARLRSAGHRVLFVTNNSASTSEEQVASLIRVTVLAYQGLFYEDASGQAVPLLAESFTMSADGLTYTFKLRRGVKFHTGQTMTSADVKYSYDYLRDSKNGSPGAGDLSTVERPHRHFQAVAQKRSSSHHAHPSLWRRDSQRLFRHARCAHQAE